MKVERLIIKDHLGNDMPITSVTMDEIVAEYDRRLIAVGVGVDEPRACIVRDEMRRAGEATRRSTWGDVITEDVALQLVESAIMDVVERA